jgi:hypothetical protein
MGEKVPKTLEQRMATFMNNEVRHVLKKNKFTIEQFAEIISPEQLHLMMSLEDKGFTDRKTTKIVLKQRVEEYIEANKPPEEERKEWWDE